ncbi:serine/threonine protein kinase [Colletotrichum plurivorum]|uniref:Serine/threonine protein kinase n=1 Tax=Colletotrichum plurivorum TaxID=2175906 RepID=A0A8H6NMK8_9PEZI|nr:serine/threonine protein kinase [Colletotrichum plurivorum]
MARLANHFKTSSPPPRIASMFHSITHIPQRFPGSRNLRLNLTLAGIRTRYQSHMRPEIIDDTASSRTSVGSLVAETLASPIMEEVSRVRQQSIQDPDVTRQPLEDRIRDNLETSYDGKEFLPESAIDELASPQIVRIHLKAGLKVTPDDASLESLVEYVTNPAEPAKKLFLLLSFCEELEELRTFRDAGFRDKHLPIAIEKNTAITEKYRYNVRSQDSNQFWDVFSAWKAKNLEDFDGKQWRFLAPVFTPKKFDYTLGHHCPLPILRRIGHEKGGHFSTVFEVILHDAHQRVLDEGNTKRIALKEMRPGMDDYYQKEADSLRIIRELRHDHLITPLAAYKRNDQLRGFLFPWAGGGNLKEFWRRPDLRPTEDPELMRWVLKQLCGICSATRALHDKNCRHTDLKPENILLFEESESWGILRIADVGLARFHVDTTQQRKSATNANTGTVRYEPPEMGRDERLSRVYDVWSLGCVFLEFLIWATYGPNVLDTFIRTSVEQQFWEKKDGDYHQHSEVRFWISKMFELLKEDTALTACLKLVDKEMLVPEVDKRSQVVDIERKFQEICTRGDTEREFLRDPDLPSRIAGSPIPVPPLPESNPRPATQANTHLQVPGIRAPAGPSRIPRATEEPSASAPQSIEETTIRISPDEYNVGDLMAGSGGCSFCQLMCDAANAAGLERDEEFKIRRVDSTFRIEPDGPTVLSIYVDPRAARNSTPSFAQLGYPQLPEPGKEFQFALFRAWLRQCDEQHNHFSNTRVELPTRVLDVGTNKDPSVCLREGEDVPKEQYIALSHCWGNGAGFRTLTRNIAAFKQDIDFDSLPASFQHAITVTRALGFRYLWIDSLCIIQDDLADWEREAVRMEQVFSHAACTIAATSASSSDEGFLFPERELRPYVAITAPSSDTAFICKSIDKFHADVEEAVLNKRGWVLQERALSRRTLHFTSSQVYWECGHGIHCESLMKLANPKAAFLGDSNFPNSALHYFKGARIVLFQSLYKKYSGLGFTKKTDRSVAIKGLEERLVKTFGTKGGFGVFNAYLQRSLLWQRDDAAFEPIPYQKDRQVPSWSWMTYSGRISYVEAPFDRVDWTNDIVSPFISESGHKQHWKVGQQGGDQVIHAIARKFTMNRVELMKRVKFDREGMGFSDDLRCVVVGVEKPEDSSRQAEHYVLAISPAKSGEPGRYTRAGVGTVLFGHIAYDDAVDVVIQ